MQCPDNEAFQTLLCAVHCHSVQKSRWAATAAEPGFVAHKSTYLSVRHKNNLKLVRMASPAAGEPMHPEIGMKRRERRQQVMTGGQAGGQAVTA